MMNLNSKLISLLLTVTVILISACSDDDDAEEPSNLLADGQFALFSATWAGGPLIDTDGDGDNDAYPDPDQGVTTSTDATGLVRSQLIESSGAPVACDGSTNAVPFVEFRATTNDTNGEIFIGCGAADPADFTRQGAWEYNETARTLTYTISNFQGTGVPFPVVITNLQFTNSGRDIEGTVNNFPYNLTGGTTSMDIVFTRQN